MTRINLAILFVPFLLCGCAQQNQLKETQFELTVEDITTGTLSKDAVVSLLEIETPSRPFSSLIVKELETYRLSYGSSISGDFKANRGSRFQYVLEFDANDGSYYSGLVFEGNTYEMVESCTLSKKSDNECVLKIEPTAHISLKAHNSLDDASESDSIWVELSDGYIQRRLAFKGRGSSPIAGGKIPHGFYELRYWVYKDGMLDYQHEESFYVKHNLDSAITIEF